MSMKSRDRTAAVLAALRAYAPDRKAAAVVLDRLQPLELARRPKPAAKEAGAIGPPADAAAAAAPEPGPVRGGAGGPGRRSGL